MTESDQTLTVIKEVFEAFDNHDLDQFRTLLDKNVVLNSGGGTQSFNGIDAVVDRISITLQAIPDLKVNVMNTFASGPNGVAEVVRKGTHTGPLLQADGTKVPPTGREVRLPECIVFKVHNQKIVRMAVYVDRLDTLRQFGLLADNN